MSPNNAVFLLATTCLVALSSSCSSRSSDPPAETGNQNLEGVAPDRISPVSLDAPDTVLEPDAPLVVDLPDSGLTIDYSTRAVRQAIAPDYLESQWLIVRTCLDLTLPAPYLYVIDGWIDSAVVDDVLFSIEGRHVATSVLNETERDAIRISSYDFDGSQGVPGFHLRSIFGRYLWTKSERPIREYNTGCASG